MKILVSEVLLMDNNFSNQTHLRNDLGADELDIVEITIALENQYDISEDEEEQIDDNFDLGEDITTFNDNDNDNDNNKEIDTKDIYNPYNMLGTSFI